MEHSTWHRLLKEELPDHYFSKINQFMDKVYEEGTIYPPRDKVFNALLETPFEEVRVVILEIRGRHWLLKKACCQKNRDRPIKG